MWVGIIKAKDLTAAKNWKDLFENEGIPVLLRAADGGAPNRESVAYAVMVPGDRDHVAQEVMRKI